jgi:hypothetical protein
MTYVMACQTCELEQAETGCFLFCVPLMACAACKLEQA